jgi:hypothetical protein
VEYGISTSEHRRPILSKEDFKAAGCTTAFSDDYVDYYKLSELLDDLFGRKRYSLRWRNNTWIVRAQDELTSGQINSVKS